MKYARIALGLMVALGMMTSTVLAQTTYYSEGFEGASLTNVLKATGLADTSAWSGGVDDISSIVAGTPTEPDTFGYPKPFKGTDHNKVLQLDTEGGTLTNELTTAVSFAKEAVYVDSMIKFVPSEDLAVIDDNGVKVAVYAYAAEDGASTNLAIYHGAYAPGGFFYTTNTITGVEIDASQWYRLTIILADDDGDVKGELVSQAMQIYLNGNIVTGDNAYTGANGEAWTDVTEDELVTGPSASGIWFVSACSLSGNEKKQIGALQFRGTGFRMTSLSLTVIPLCSLAGYLRCHADRRSRWIGQRSHQFYQGHCWPEHQPDLHRQRVLPHRQPDGQWHCGGGCGRPAELPARSQCRIGNRGQLLQD